MAVCGHSAAPPCSLLPSLAMLSSAAFLQGHNLLAAVEQRHSARQQASAGMEAAAEHGAALKSVLAPTGHADSLALVERGGSWSPQQRLKRARADPSASGSGSQETHSPGASHATTASAARVEPLPAGVALGDTAGDNGKGALFTLSAVCHDALHADEANAAGWKGCAVKEGTAPAEQDSASSQALAFSMWGTGDTGAPGTRSTRPSGDTSPQPQQQAQRRSGPISTATATEEERLRCQAELATTRLLGSNSPAIIPQVT